MKTPKITFDEAHSLLSYNPDSGEFSWKTSAGGSKKNDTVGTVQHGYRRIQIKNEQLRIHRLAWFMTYGVWPSGQIDHIDGNKLNNKISNLRDVPMSINMQNRYSIKRKESGLPYGVSRHKSGKFHANIRIGTFDTAEEACAAYMEAKRLLHKGCTR